MAQFAVMGKDYINLDRVSTIKEDGKSVYVYMENGDTGVFKLEDAKELLQYLALNAIY